MTFIAKIEFLWKVFKYWEDCSLPSHDFYAYAYFSKVSGSPNLNLTTAKSTRTRQIICGLMCVAFVHLFVHT